MPNLPKYRMASSLLIPLIGPAKSENLVNHIKAPYSHWENEHQCIFVHVPKAAGKSISRALLGAPNGTGHNKLKCYERNKEKFRIYKKVSVVRNPWDRLVSAFFYLNGLSEKSNGGCFFRRHIGEGTEFKTFVERLADQRYRARILEWEHFTPQRRFLVNGRGVINIDLVARFETLDADYEKMKSLINPNAEALAKLNASERGRYEDYYDEALSGIVREVYLEDIKEFGYQF